jgi:hypothetical protein
LFQNLHISNLRLVISTNFLVHINALLALTPSLSKARTTPLGSVSGMPHAFLSYTAFSICISIITLLSYQSLLWIYTVRNLETPAIIGFTLWTALDSRRRWGHCPVRTAAIPSQGRLKFGTFPYRNHSIRQVLFKTHSTDPPNVEPLWARGSAKPTLLYPFIP